MRDHSGGWNLFLHGHVLETVNHFIDTDHFLARDLASISFLSVFGDGLSAVDHLLDFDGFLVWHSLLVFDRFRVWNAHGFHDFSCGLDLFWNVFVVGLVETLFYHFGAWNLFLNRFVLEAVDDFVDGDHFFRRDFAGSILKQVMVLVSVHAGAQVVGAQVGSQELAGREQADGEAQADMMISDGLFQWLFCCGCNTLTGRFG